MYIRKVMDWIVMLAALDKFNAQVADGGVGAGGGQGR
jgi:hypothetical protein